MCTHKASIHCTGKENARASDGSPICHACLKALKNDNSVHRPANATNIPPSTPIPPMS